MEECEKTPEELARLLAEQLEIVRSEKQKATTACDFHKAALLREQETALQEKLREMKRKLASEQEDNSPAISEHSDGDKIFHALLDRVAMLEARVAQLEQKDIQH